MLFDFPAFAPSLELELAAIQFGNARFVPGFVITGENVGAGIDVPVDIGNDGGGVVLPVCIGMVGGGGVVIGGFVDSIGDVGYNGDVKINGVDVVYVDTTVVDAAALVDMLLLC